MTHDLGISLEMDSAVAVQNRGYWGENTSCSQRTNIKTLVFQMNDPVFLLFF